jgi:septal ring-binding cell division protein DamX
MPELNLIEDDNSGGPSAAPSSAARRRPPRGGGFGRVLIILLVLIFVLVAVYLANEYGVLNLWGKKEAPETAQQQPAFPEEPFGETPGQADTAMVSPAGAEQPAEEQPPVEVQQQPPAEEKLVEPKSQPPKAETAPPPPAGDVSTMSGSYTIQFSAWRDRATADELSGRLVRAGLPAFVESIRFGSNTWYTVRVGRYGSAQAARAALSNMPREIREHYWIDKVRTP